MHRLRRLTLRAAGLLAGTSVAAVYASVPRGVHAQALPQIVSRARASIVAIGSFERLRNPQFAFHGTGFIVGNGNLVATCAHVVPELNAAGSAQIAMAMPASGGARVLPLAPFASNEDADLALLRFQGPALPGLALAAPDAASEGMDVAMIGYPLGAALGLHPATHRGVIAAIAPMVIPRRRAAGLDPKAVQRLRADPIEVLQLDVTAYPGNSGSPLLDASSGQVLGVVSMAAVKGSRESAISAPTGISYAVPVQQLLALLPTER